jgi:hypothetical protein
LVSGSRPGDAIRIVAERESTDIPGTKPAAGRPIREASDNPEAETLRDAIRCENHTDRAAGLAQRVAAIDKC